MAGGERKPEESSTAERMGDLARAKTSAIKHKLKGEQEDRSGPAYIADLDEVRSHISDWPSAPRNIAEEMIEQYGPPNEATPVRLLWHYNGPWKRTEVTRDEIVHDFPTSHTDFITQWVDYRVPPERFADIARFDGSCLADRTAGEAAARCDSEPMNILTLNLMHDIVTHKRTVDEAREVFAVNAAAFTLGRSAPYAERLQFEPAAADAGDPDEKVIGDAMVQQMAEKAKDIVAGGRGGVEA